MNDWLACNQSNLFTAYLFNDLQTIHSQSILRKLMNYYILFHYFRKVLTIEISFEIFSIFFIRFSSYFKISIGFAYLFDCTEENKISSEIFETILTFNALTVAFYIYSW